MNEKPERPYGCKCQSLSHKMCGDGCDECSPERVEELKREWLDDAQKDYEEAKHRVKLAREEADRAHERLLVEIEKKDEALDEWTSLILKNK